MARITDFEQARQTAEGIRLFLERLAGAEAVLGQAIAAEQALDDWARTHERLEEEHAGLQLARHELEAELAELAAQRQSMRDAIAEEGTRVARQQVAELEGRLATLEHDTRHAADAFAAEVTARTARLAELEAEEDRLAKLCHKHRAQLGKIRAEVLRAMDEEERGA